MAPVRMHAYKQPRMTFFTGRCVLPSAAGMSTLEEVQREIVEVKAQIADIRKLDSNDPFKPTCMLELPGLQQQLAELYKEKNRLAEGEPLGRYAAGVCALACDPHWWSAVAPPPGGTIPCGSASQERLLLPSTRRAGYASNHRLIASASHPEAVVAKRHMRQQPMSA